VHVNRENGHVVVSAADSGAGLPAAFDLSGKKGLGLKVTRIFQRQGSRFAFEFDESASRKQKEGPRGALFFVCRE
jgi:two-component sensor histidine kinase